MINLLKRELSISLGDPQQLDDGCLRFSLFVTSGASTVIEVRGFTIRYGFLNPPGVRYGKGGMFKIAKIHEKLETAILEVAKENWSKAFPNVFHRDSPQETVAIEL